MTLKEAIEHYKPWWDNRHYQTLCPESVQALLSNWFWRQGGCTTNFKFSLDEVNEFMSQPFKEYRP